MRKQFYEKALPAQGVYCVALINPESGRTRHEYAHSLEELFGVLDRCSQQTESNVYVTPCSFGDEARTASNAVFSRSFFVDLDVNHGKVCYTSKEEAASALDEFLEESELPPPVRIDSGGGLQAYWLFEEDVAIEDWKVYAAKFKQYCSDKGLLIDPAVTADAARVMRCPGTLNLRTQTQAAVLSSEIDQYDFGAFKEFLDVYVADTASVLATLKPKGPIDEETRAIAMLDNFEDSFAWLAKNSLAGAGCNQIKYALENVATLSYDQWLDALSVAHRCSDRAEAIRLVSEGHPGYKPEEAEFKANETGKASGPRTCATFENNNPGGCDGCPFKGKITSPIYLARKLRVPTAPTGPLPPPLPVAPEDDSVWGEGDDHDLLIFPEYLEPYTRGIHGGIYYTPPAKVDKEGKVTQEPPVQILNRAVYPYKRMFSARDGECFMIRTVMPLDGYREFLLPVDNVYSQDLLSKALVQSGATYDPDKIKQVMKYFIRWSEYLSSTVRAEQMRMQMGWTENFDAFIVGNTEIRSTGEAVKAASSPLVRAVAKHLKTEGSYEIWKRAIRTLNEPGFEMHAFGMITGFGSPLMCFTPVAGASICFTSADSGAAKTGALYASLSIWGHPKNMSLVDQGATQNGFIGRYLNLKNIPFGIDEASNADPKDLANLVHAVSHGKAKVRMQSSVNAEREHEDSASLIAFFTSNQSIYDRLRLLKGSPDGEMARVIEFTIKKPPQLNTELGTNTFNVLKQNYGFAGIEYMQHVAKVGLPRVKELVNKWLIRFMNEIGDNTGYRFYQGLVGASFAGAELAVEAGIIELDIERVFNTVIMEIIQLRDDTVKINSTDYPALVTEFLYQNWSGMLILEEPNKVIQEPMAGRPLIARSEIYNSTQYISKSEFRKFLAAKQVSSREFEKAMQQHGLITKLDRHRLSTGWKTGFHANPVSVYAIKAELPKDMIDKDAAAN
jgi:hypothetical protein